MPGVKLIVFSAMIRFPFLGVYFGVSANRVIKLPLNYTFVVAASGLGILTPASFQTIFFSATMLISGFFQNTLVFSASRHATRGALNLRALIPGGSSRLYAFIGDSAFFFSIFKRLGNG
jgi:hypothetical protein